MRLFIQRVSDGLHGVIRIIAYFFRIGLYISFVHAGEHMIHFMLGKPVVESCSVSKAENFLQAGFKPHFFLQPAQGSGSSVFAGQGMTAAGVGPQTTTVVFVSGSLLEQHFAPAVENKNAECPVQQPFLVGLHFIHSADRLIGFIN